MKNLDNSLLGSANLDEAISNTDGQSTNTTTNSSKGLSGSDWAALGQASTQLFGQVFQATTTPRNEEESACGRPQPWWSSSRKDDYNKCAENFRNRTSSASSNNFMPPATEQKTTNWWLVGGSIVGGLAVLGTLAYFIFRPKK